MTDKSLPPSLLQALHAWTAAASDPEGSYEAGKAIARELGALPPEQTADGPLAIIHANEDVLGKKSVWAIGGDGWAYDIGFAGLDHVLASGEDINLLVMDTECYANTGGQTSKATPLGAVTKYSPAGKRTFKKDLGRMMMTYGTVYVASVALGADYQHTIDALREAEAYPGPSIVICYCPCINHGIRKGLGHSIVEEREAVEQGYWPVYRFNPAIPGPDGRPTLTDDSPAASTLTLDGLNAFLDGEDRYADIRLVAPADATRLRQKLSDRMRLINIIIRGLSTPSKA